MATQTSIELLEPIASPGKDNDLQSHASTHNLSMAGPEPTEAARRYLPRGRSIIVMIQLAYVGERLTQHVADEKAEQSTS